MYNPNIMTDTERDTPPGIQAMAEQMREMQAFSNHRLGPRYQNTYTDDEMIYLNQMSMNERFESSHRPRPGSGRNILHAAAIFDPGYAPAAVVRYELPRRPYRYSSGDFASHGGMYRHNYGDPHQRNDSGYESARYMIVGDEEEDDGIDAWCDAVLAQRARSSPLDPNRHILRPDAPCFEPCRIIDAEANDLDGRESTQEVSGTEVDHLSVFPPPNDNQEYRHSALLNPDLREHHTRDGRSAVTSYELDALDYHSLTRPLERRTRGTQSEPGDSNQSYYYSSFEYAEGREEQTRDRRFAVTEYELEVLDYEGLTSQMRRGRRETKFEYGGSDDDDGRFNHGFRDSLRAMRSFYC